MKVILHHSPTPGLRDLLVKLSPGWLNLVIVDEADKAGLAREIVDAIVIWHVLEPLGANEMAPAANLKLIQKIGVGTDTIDLKTASDMHIAVANMPGSNSRAVAEMTLTLMLNVYRKGALLDRLVRSGSGWGAAPELFDTSFEVCGKTVGLVGYGLVPRLLTPILQAMGAKVLYVASSRKDDVLAEWCPLPDLLARADILSLHVPDNAQTHGMICKASLVSDSKPYT